jgi:4-amino-4-deoxy-L-arabinose transferase-like glycosyltransferase
LTLPSRFVKTRIVRGSRDQRKYLAIAIGVMAVAARLIAINQPYIDNWSWRQSDVAAIARNYYDNGFHFPYPQIDWAGDAPGYVGTEFPILPFLAAICYKLAGVHEWIGRIQAVIFFAASLPCFFLLVREISGELAATWALLFYSFAPLSLFASREFMPDVPSLSLAIIGLYFFLRWIENAERRFFFASAILISLSILIKLPSVLIGAPIACVTVAAPKAFGVAPLSKNSCDGHRPPLQPILLKECDGHRPPLQLLALFATIALLPSAIWYWHAHQIAVRFYPHHFFGAGGIQIMSVGWYWKIAKQIATSSLTPVLFALALIGAFVTSPPVGRTRPVARSIGRAPLFHWWLAAMVVFIIVVGYGNRHQWYQLPLVPVAAAFGGAGCAFAGSKISARKIKVTLSILLAALSAALAFAYVRPLYQSPSSVALRDLGLELNRMTPKNSLIAAADNGDPTVFYYAERKGWHFPEKEGIYNGEPKETAQAIADLEQLRSRGANYLVFTKDTKWWLDYYRAFAQHLAENATLMETASGFKIYELKSVKASP